MSELDGMLRRDLMQLSEAARRNNYRDLLGRALRYGPPMTYPALMMLDRIYTEREHEPRDGTRSRWGEALVELAEHGFARAVVDDGKERWAEITPKGREWFRL